MNRTFICIGHRGTRILDENTTYAFTKALKYGAEYIEFDIRKTKDNKLIVMHDATLERTTSGEGLIKNFTYDQICKYKTKKNNEKIPLLSDVLEIFKGKIKFMIELKEINIRTKILDLIHDKGLLNHCIISGRNLRQILLIKKEYPESKICYNITKGMGLTLSEFLNQESVKKKNYELDIISLKSHLVSSKFIETCHRNKILTLAWDFIDYSNPLDKMKALIKSGIDGILFDNYKNIPIIMDWLRKS